MKTVWRHLYIKHFVTDLYNTTVWRHLYNKHCEMVPV